MSHHAHMARDFKIRFWVCLPLTVPILLLSPSIREALNLDAIAFAGDTYVLLALATFLFAYGGWPFFKGMVEEFKKKAPGMMTLIALAITVAYFYSAAVSLGLTGEPENALFWELATLVDVMLLGHWLEMRSVIGASGALEKLAQLLPSTAHLLSDDGKTRDVPVEELKAGDRVLVKPGEKVPVDGTIDSGETSVNESALTGESRPAYKGEGDEVIGGSVNGEGAVEVTVEKTGSDTYMSQVIELVRSSQESKSRAQDLANRAAFWLTVIAITVGVVTLAVWLIVGETFEFSIERTVSVMVITCPHALGLAIPLVIAVSTTLAAKSGLLIRERTAFERSRNVQTVVFDKTGTLTSGEFRVSNVVSFGPSEDELLALAAAVEAKSEHSIARGIVAEARERGLEFGDAEDFKIIPGKGAVGRVEGKEVATASGNYLEANDIPLDKGEAEDLESEGFTVVYVVQDGKAVGAVTLEDEPREESLEAVRRLHEFGLRCVMLTGDNEHVARRVSEELELDDFYAEVLPDEKASRIKELKEDGTVVAMVGDGVNDAPALVEADLGIAIGAGTEVAIESADVVLVSDDPRDIISVLELAGATYRKTVQNLAWATGYNVFAIPAAAGVLFPLGIVVSPAIGAVFMSLSTVIVAVNAKLMKAPEGSGSEESE